MTTVTASRYVGVGSRNELFSIVSGNPVIIEAGGGNDFLWPFTGNDVLYGQAGRDLIWGDPGNDLIFGDFGTDDSFPGSPAGGDADAIQAGSGNDVVFASVGNDFANGEAGSDFVDGGSGDDILWGGSGVDSIFGGTGNDTLVGGAGSVVPDAAKLAVSLDFNGSTDVAITPASVVTGSGGELAANDPSNDILDGGDGNDLLDGGLGADLMKGGSGNDTFLVDNPLDVVVEAIGDGFDTVRTTVSYALSLTAEIEVLLAADPAATTGLRLTGSNTANALTGDAGNNILLGLKGNDDLFGLLGNDVLNGGLDNDELDGGAGNDVLVGGAGKDILRGGIGKDIFVFNAKPDALTNVDRVLDFKSVDDFFRIDNAFFKKVGSNGKLKADAFHLGKKAADAEDRIIYDKGTGSLYYDPDGTGGAAQIKFATLVNKAGVVLGDFIVI